jgi:putative DNA primase/helicase
MIDAYTIAHALDGVAISGGWKCRCPVSGHGKGEGDRDRSLFVCDGDTPGRVLVTCYANCDRQDIIEELKRQGLWPTAKQHNTAAPQATAAPQPQPSPVSNYKIAYALNIWRYSRLADGSLVETYLRSRAITLSPLPLTLRCHMALQHRPSNARWPAMVALVTHDHEYLGVHRTYLAWDGSGKAPIEPQKMTFGPVRGGAVRLGPLAESIFVAEGIETALSVMQATGQVAWAALSANGIANLQLPPTVRDVTICVDGDQVSEDAAAHASRRWLLQGLQVRIARPPPNKDFNDVLLESN